MRSFLPILALCLLIFSSCTKSETAQPAEEEKLLCNTSAEATVNRMILNEDGSEYFYYLQFENAPVVDKVVFPKNLSSSFQQEGLKVMVDFSKTSDFHTYVVCLEGHQFDPENPDTQSMPIVQVCGAEEVNF